MSKRRKDRRKKGAIGEENFPAARLGEAVGLGDRWVRRIEDAPMTREDAPEKMPDGGGSPEAAADGGTHPRENWLGDILLVLLILYTALLGLGTVGELFEVEWILRFPIFR